MFVDLRRCYARYSAIQACLRVFAMRC